MTSEKASELKVIQVNLDVKLNNVLKTYELWNICLKQAEGSAVPVV